MIRETMIAVNERLCGVNDMTFEEWEQYQDQMLRYYNVYQYDNVLYKEDENDSLEEEESSDEDHESDDDNHDRVYLCDPTDFNAGTCCCSYLGLECDG